MNSASQIPGNGAYSVHNSLKPTNFFCNAPKAGTVLIEGDFNHWFAVPMQRRVDGWWHIQVLLCHGHHQYRFLIDGTPALDPAAAGTGRDEGGEPVSLTAVS